MEKKLFMRQAMSGAERIQDADDEGFLHAAFIKKPIKIYILDPFLPFFLLLSSLHPFY